MNKMRIAVALVVSLLIINVQAQIQKKQNELATKGIAEITFKEKSHDFGTIKEGEVVETIFEFTNTGDIPLVISKIKASCGCTVPSNWSRDPIQPGEESSFSVKFDSKNKPNKQSKTVTVHSNAKKGVDYVSIKLFVTPNPEREALRLEMATKRQEQYRIQKELAAARKEKQTNDQLAKKDIVVLKSKEQQKREMDEKIALEKKRKSAVDATSDLKQEREKTKKEVKKLAKEKDKLAMESKKLEKETKKAAKERKRAAMEVKKEKKKAKKLKKKEAKEAKKMAKRASKIEKASNAISVRENKISKLEAKLKKTETQGDLSPNEKLDYEAKIVKLNEKLEKEKKVLEKLQNK